jgi:hypothetical protein
MILLFNVKITSQGLSYYHRSDWLPKYSRMDIFKYCLASYAAMLPVLSKCIFYIQVEPEFADRQSELEAYIHELFPADRLELHWHRINHTRDWRKLCEQFTNDNELIFFAGNDDHIFIDSSLDMLRAGIKNLQEDPHPYRVIYYSHWPEQMRLSMHHNGELTADGNYVKYTWRTFDAIRILKVARFKKYWQDNEYGDEIVFRTDTLWHKGYELTAPVYAPLREMVRHYDGYSHVSQQLINIVPPLVIPDGFFSTGMKIRIGFDQHEHTWTNFNPLAQWLYTAQPHGADYRWVQEDIPLFWKDQIVCVDTNKEVDPTVLYQARDAAYVASTIVPMHCYSTDFDHTNGIPVEWLSQHLISHG